MDYKNQSWILNAFGVLLLLVGIAALAFGPAEMYCFYLFSDGGPFHYEGFGFGSFMFGNLATQIIGYYVVAILLIPLGYGHLRLRRWARNLALTLLYAWLVLGVPLIIVFLFILVTAKDLSPIAALAAVFLLGLSYLILPGLLIRYYQSRHVRLTFEGRDPEPHWIEQRPLPVLVLCFLLLFYIVVLHILIFFRGIFPFFGEFLFELEGILAIDFSILCLVWLLWGLARQRVWAWWGALAFFSLLTFSSILTFAKSSYSDILSKLSFPPTEMEALDGLPFQGVHFAVLVGVPLLLTLGAIVLSRRHFGGRLQVAVTSPRGSDANLSKSVRTQEGPD
jgi:hypothetical protein